MNLSCMIIDDEPNAVNLLEMLILESTQWQIKAKCFNALEALAFLKSNQVDFIFLDINMPKLTGMELAALLPKQTKIVFTTAYSEYALESYSFQTIDYLLKPITLKRLLSAIQKIESFFVQTETVRMVTPVPEEDYFFIKSGKTIRKIRLEDILYFEGEREYVRVVTGQEQLLVYRRLKDIEEQMSPPFVRVHNSYIVNTRQLVKMEDNHIHIADKRIPVGEKFKEGFMEVINKRKF
jgi:two-component system, LytTR family, response regulator